MSALPEFLQYRFRLNQIDNRFREEIVEAVRFYKLVHRIDGFANLSRLPAGFDTSSRGAPGGYRVIVSDWEKSDADWREGTVGGFTKATVRNRHAIRLWWPRVVFWAEPYTSRLLRPATAPSITIQSNSAGRDKNRFAPARGLIGDPVGCDAVERSGPSSRLSTASKAMVKSVVLEVYSYAETRQMKPPNAKQMGVVAAQILRERGFSAAQTNAERIAGGPEFDRYRLKQGDKASGKFQVFSLEYWSKSGPEN